MEEDVNATGMARRARPVVGLVVADFALATCGSSSGSRPGAGILWADAVPYDLATRILPRVAERRGTRAAG